MRAMAAALATRQRYSASTVDQIPKHVSAGLMFGTAITIPIPDVDRTDMLVILGANPLESNGSLFTAPDLPGRLQALVERGGEVVVVDPRRTKTAEMATEHLAIRPGTDALLLLGIVNTLFAEGLVTLGAVEQWVNGVDERSRARRSLPGRARRPGMRMRRRADPLVRPAHRRRRHGRRLRADRDLHARVRHPVLLARRRRQRVDRQPRPTRRRHVPHTGRRIARTPRASPVPVAGSG